jgi:benzoate/toluate 1,2-dioxygenase reductase component
VTDQPCHDVQFRFADGVEHSVVVPHGSTVLDAALAQDVPLLFQCRSGTCSSCSAHLVEGEADMRAGQASVLLASEAASGMRLLCCTEARSQCSFALDYDSKASGGGPRKASAFVDSVERIASDAVRLVLELAEGDWINFRPGQFVQVKVPGTDKCRSYSIASTPDDLPRIELLIRLLPGGLMSRWLTEAAKPDAVIELEGPFGSFFLTEKPRAPVIMIAGGTGLAPMMAMIDTIRTQPGRKPPILLSFGCASPEGLFNREELSLRQQWMPGLEVRTSVDRNADESGLLLGNPVSAVCAEDVRDEETKAYLCGPPGLINAARTHLQSLGLKAENIHAEQFVASQ